MNGHRDAGAVIGDADGFGAARRGGRQERHLNFVTGAIHRLVARVVKNFHQEVVEAVGAGRADIHPRALAHRLQTLQNHDILGVVFAFFRHLFRHIYAFSLAYLPLNTKLDWFSELHNSSPNPFSYLKRRGKILWDGKVYLQQ